MDLLGMFTFSDPAANGTRDLARVDVVQVQYRDSLKVVFAVTLSDHYLIVADFVLLINRLESPLGPNDVAKMVITWRRESQVNSVDKMSIQIS